MLASIMMFDEPLANHTTFGIGGPAACMVYPENREELSMILKYAACENIPAFFIGSGSNILVWDEGFDGFVISLRKTFKKNSKPLAGSSILPGKRIVNFLSFLCFFFENLFVSIPEDIAFILLMPGKQAWTLFFRISLYTIT